MSIFLEITQLENGDIVLREAQDEDAEEGASALTVGQTLNREPLVSIRFSDEVREMLGAELVDVAEAMIDAASDYLGGDSIEIEADPLPPVVH